MRRRPQIAAPLNARPEPWVSRRRDIAQAMAVAAIAKQYLGLGFETEELSALPRNLVHMTGMLLATA